MALVWKDEINSIITIKGNNFLKSIGKHDEIEKLPLFRISLTLTLKFI